MALRVQWCPLDQEFSKSNTLLIPKDYNHNFSSWWHSCISSSLELYQWIMVAQLICFNMIITVYQFMKLANVVRNQCSASATTLWSVMKCYSSCLSFFTPSYLSSSSSHNHTSLTMHFQQTFMNASQLLTFSSQKCYHCSLFQLNTKLCHFRINCGDAIYWVKQLQLVEHNRECSMISLM